jgi:RNA polymerase sigma-70 factor (ECF subfamily)
MVMDDPHLIGRLAMDLDGTFEELVRGQADRCYAIALRILGDPADAEEVAQDALVRAYRALATYDAQRIRELRLRGWLATIVANLARNRLRRHRLRTTPLGPLVEAGGEPASGLGTDPESLTGRRAEQRRLARAVLDLPDRYRMPVVLRHVDDLSYDEIAAALGRPIGTVKAQVHRGLALLRIALLDEPTPQELTA